ncbi:MAG: aminotransferase class I/II-fold pyridoxal phosphate-dependent enzyme, partial [Treponema sp.]|nr:aminotransferase class I/II-fold pyridoxal phosphate-dependent enzyme [Treponema sp.]
MIIAQRMNNLHPYIPGEQPKDREYIKLNANENPYPPSTDVIDKAIESLRKKSKMMTLYPDPDSNELHKAIAEMLNQTGGVLCRCVSDGEKIQPSKEDKIPFTVTPEMIYSGNGSDEVLSFVFYAFFDSSKKFIMPEFTYSFYPVYAGFYNIPSELVKLNDDWSLNKEKIIELANKNDSGVIFANPNAPTGIGL